MSMGVLQRIDEGNVVEVIQTEKDAELGVRRIRVERGRQLEEMYVARCRVEGCGYETEYVHNYTGAVRTRDYHWKVKHTRFEVRSGE